jgi:hypothetical protein
VGPTSDKLIREAHMHVCQCVGCCHQHLTGFMGLVWQAVLAMAMCWGKFSLQWVVPIPNLVQVHGPRAVGCV